MQYWMPTQQPWMVLPTGGTPPAPGHSATLLPTLAAVGIICACILVLILVVRAGRHTANPNPPAPPSIAAGSTTYALSPPTLRDAAGNIITLGIDESGTVKITAVQGSTTGPFAVPKVLWSSAAGCGGRPNNLAAWQLVAQTTQYTFQTVATTGSGMFGLFMDNLGNVFVSAGGPTSPANQYHALVPVYIGNSGVHQMPAWPSVGPSGAAWVLTSPGRAATLTFTHSGDLIAALVADPDTPTFQLSAISGASFPTCSSPDS